MFDPNKPTEVEEKKLRDCWYIDLHRASESQDKHRYPFLDFLTSPGGEGLLSGYSTNYATTDCLSRYKRVKGFILPHPKGSDFYQKPTEERVSTPRNHAREKTDQVEIEALSCDSKKINQRTINVKDINIITKGSPSD